MCAEAGQKGHGHKIWATRVNRDLRLRRPDTVLVKITLPIKGVPSTDSIGKSTRSRFINDLLN